MSLCWADCTFSACWREALATGITPSPWLLAFCLFFFLSLALVKRYTELRDLQDDKSKPVAGRGYVAMDLPTIGAIGTGSGCMCVLVLALYINNVPQCCSSVPFSFGALVPVSFAPLLDQPCLGDGQPREHA